MLRKTSKSNPIESIFGKPTESKKLRITLPKQVNMSGQKTDLTPLIAGLYSRLVKTYGQANMYDVVSSAMFGNKDKRDDQYTLESLVDLTNKAHLQGLKDLRAFLDHVIAVYPVGYILVEFDNDQYLIGG